MTAQEILARLPSLAAQVVGDICLDRWCVYDPAEAEPSRETGLPRVAVISVEVTPGAGGTITNNLRAMGVGRVAVLGSRGDDGHGMELRRALETRGVETTHLLIAPGQQTFTYTKLLNARTGEEDLPRLDFVNQTPMPAETERQILDRLQQAVDDFDMVLVSDQAETTAGGVITPAVRDLLADLAPAFPDKVFLADSRRRIESFRNLMLKPNEQEAETASRLLFGSVDYPALRTYTRARLLVVTHGPDGVDLVTAEGSRRIPTRRVEEPLDICGAGDSFSAGFTAALAAGGTPEEAVRFGGLIASITVMKKGTGIATPEEILHADAGD